MPIKLLLYLPKWTESRNISMLQWISLWFTEGQLSGSHNYLSCVEIEPITHHSCQIHVKFIKNSHSAFETVFIFRNFILKTVIIFKCILIGLLIKFILFVIWIQNEMKMNEMKMICAHNFSLLSSILFKISSFAVKQTILYR